MRIGRVGWERKEKKVSKEDLKEVRNSYSVKYNGKGFGKRRYNVEKWCCDIKKR